LGELLAVAFPHEVHEGEAGNENIRGVLHDGYLRERELWWSLVRVR
jgi:hypothetical protein